MKIVKVKVGKGQTVEVEPNKWVKEFYELHAELEFEGEVEATKEKILSIIDSWLFLKSVSKQRLKTDIPSFTNLVWFNYQRELCEEEDEAGWTFNNEDARTLADLLQAVEKGEWKQIGNMEYRLGGRDFSLINRRKVKKNRKKIEGKTSH